jgi:hypothetical protein
MKQTTVWFLAFIFALCFVSQGFSKTLLNADELKTKSSLPTKRAKRVQANVEGDEAEGQIKTPVKEADNGLDLRKIRRMGIGAQAAGGLGFGGVLLDLNLTSNWSFLAGYGGGEGFSALELQGKYILTGEWLLPYAGFGYSRWSSNSKGSPIQKTNPAILSNRLLNDDEKAAGEFQKNLFLTSLGVQFITLKGEWAGSSVFAELTVLLDPANLVAAPTGALGFLYYF